ncbi:MAG: alditol oxidase [Actinomycetota bacterium]|nr:alditol oxidase [Actinomycetota bacterium]
MTLTNWAGNITFGAARVHRPGTLEELRSVVAASDRVRALGSAHSFSPVADTTDDLVSVAGLPARVDVSADRSTATVAAGMRYGEVAVALQAQGLALHNLGSLPHISVAGAVATGTHGSGPTLGSLSTAVVGLDLVTATGAMLRLDRTDLRFPGAVVGLGALGVVTAVTLAVQPTYDVAQTVYQDLPVRRLATDLDEILAAGYSVSLFTTWSRDVVDQIWVKRRTDDPRAALDPGWLDTHAATGPLHPVPGMSPASCTEQLGVPGPWHERLPHFRLDHTPSSGAELQTEYLVPRRHAVAALDAVQAMAPRVAAVLQVSELRTVAADDLWLSPAYEQDSLAVHFTWVDDAAAVAPVVAELEQRLAPLGPRPHWGKVFTMPPAAVQPLYPRLADVAALRRELDPNDVFGNAMVDEYLGSAGT